MSGLKISVPRVEGSPEAIRANIARRPTLETFYNVSRALRSDGHNSAADKLDARMRKVYRMLYEFGPGNGTFHDLPYDQMVEHGIVHQQGWPGSATFEYVLKLANTRFDEPPNRHIFSGVVLHPGIIEKYYDLIPKGLPKIIKLDCHFSGGKGGDSPHPGDIFSVQWALDHGADFIGLSFYPGCEDTTGDIERVGAIIEQAHFFGVPVVLWAL